MRTFFKQHTLPIIACIAAAISACFVPPTAAYVDYFDFKTLCCLFCISATVNALVGTGLFARLARRIVTTLKTQRACVLAMVLITLVGAMFITNDMALLTFLPLSYLVLRNVKGSRKLLAWCFVLQNAAAVLGGMILPFGNPHNLYLYSLFNIPTGTFIATMAPTFLAAVVLIGVCCLAVKPVPLQLQEEMIETAEAAESTETAEALKAAEKSKTVGTTGLAETSHQSHQRDTHNQCDKRNKPSYQAESAQTQAAIFGKYALPRSAELGIYGALFVVTLLAILRVIPYLASFALVFAVLLIVNHRILTRVDYGLLITFAAFFVFAGNMSNIPAVKEFLVSMLAQNALLTTVGTCQVISNLPTTLLLAPFTTDWATLLVATDIAGMGTPIASLASLITIKAFMGYRRDDTGLFMRMFLVIGFGFLAILTAVAALTL